MRNAGLILCFNLRRCGSIIYLHLRIRTIILFSTGDVGRDERGKLHTCSVNKNWLGGIVFTSVLNCILLKVW